MTQLLPTPRCDAEVYESGPTAANYGISDPDVVVDYTFAQQLERELIAATQARADLEAEVKRLAIQQVEGVDVQNKLNFCKECGSKINKQIPVLLKGE